MPGHHPGAAHYTCRSRRYPSRTKRPADPPACTRCIAIGATTSRWRVLWLVHARSGAARAAGATHPRHTTGGPPAVFSAAAPAHTHARRRVRVVAPYHPNPSGPAHKYWLGIDRVVPAILLGIVTRDANLLVIYPPQKF